MKGLRQETESKKGEIAFRRELYRQHVDGERVFDDEYDSVQILDVLKARMEKTRRQVESLVSQGVGISRFLELGAERGQRSLVMTNEFGAQGFAADISYESLRSVRHFAERFGMDKLPILVCCDAYNLPFRNNALPFAFSYLTVHHFPDPAPIIAEIHRVLAKGFFFFDEEPFKRLLHIGLYRRRRPRSSSDEQRNLLIKIFQAIFSDLVHKEEEYGITENENIPCAMWKDLLQPFDSAEATLQSAFGIQSSLHASLLNPRHLLNRLMGGSISGLCKKTTANSLEAQSIWEALGCPNCRIEDPRGRADRAPLHREDSTLKCTHCNSTFPLRDGVHFLFSQADLRELYPALSD